MNSLIREELGKMFERELEFPEALVTITDVEVNPEMEAAIVNFSVLPSEKSDRVLEILNDLEEMVAFYGIDPEKIPWQSSGAEDKK